MLWAVSLIVISLIGCKAPEPKQEFRIISLAPSITEELFALGLGDNIVGVTTYCNTPEEAKRKHKIGTVLNINIEEIVRLSPDLIFGVEGFTKEDDIRILKRAGFSPVLLKSPRDFGEITENLREIGRLTGKREKADLLIEKASREVERIKTEDARCKVFFQIGAEPLITAGSNTFINSMITTAGGINIAEDVSGYKRFSIEEVIKRDPEIIIIALMGTEAERLERKRWTRFGFSKVYSVDQDLFCRPTVERYVEAVKVLSDIFQ
jgi:iron complex transport system substrate-binding protein